MIEEDDMEENWADPGAPSSGTNRPGIGNDNDDGEGGEDTQGGEKGTGKRKGRKDGTVKAKATEKRKGKGKGKGKGNGEGKGIVKPTPGEDDISCAIALHWQKVMSEADLHTES